MGFTEEQATIALQSSAGDVSRAINLLLEQTTRIRLPREAAPRPQPSLRV